MALKLEGQQCPVCKSYLFEDDDIVFCPECGAPHHRGCYKKLGHCGLENYHGTGQPNRNNFHSETGNTYRCGRCGRSISTGAAYCPYCGNPLFAGYSKTPPFGYNVFFDPYGGVSPSDRIEDVPAEDIKNFVAYNTQRYLPLFKSLSKRHRANWNFAAFFFPEGWFFFRKQYRFGVIAMLFLIVAGLCELPLVMELDNLRSMLPINATQQQLFQFLYQNMDKIGMFPIIMAFVSIAISLAVRFTCAILGDYLYRNHVISNIKHIKYSSEDYDTEIVRKGGISPIWFGAAILLTRFLPGLLGTLIL